MENVEKRLSKKAKIIIAVAVAAVVCAGAVAGVLLYNPLKLKKDTVTVEFGQHISLEASTYLKKDVDKSIVKNTKVTYKAKPVEGQSYDQIGDYTVKLKYEDKTKEVKVSVVDTTKPEFCATADAGIDTIAGVELDLTKLITATDLSGAEVTFKNADKVDLNTAGEYTLKAVAKDKAGNTTKKDIKVTVAEKPANMTGSEVSVDPSTGKVTVQAQASTPAYGGASNGGSYSGGSYGSGGYGGSSGGSGSSKDSVDVDTHYGGEIGDGGWYNESDWVPLPEGW
ncbi:MAG: hypothetical protein ACLU7V_01095 [Anaerovoracaceae bacterium]